VGIDFSKSNEWTGEKSYGKHLHGTDYKNPYLHTLEILEPIISKFDDDNFIPAFRFGCMQSKNLSVLPLLAPQQMDPHFAGFEALKQGYLQALTQVKMSGPTTFAPLILQAIEIEKAHGGHQLLHLIIITDGNVSNVQNDKLAIVAASQFPISITAIGVGDGPFDKMVEFDDMQGSGRLFDNFQFVDFTKFEGEYSKSENADELLAALVFNELPEQYSAMEKLGYL